jgi:hypothetical protein
LRAPNYEAILQIWEQQMKEKQSIIMNLMAACTTGEPCLVSPGPRCQRVPAISRDGLGLLTAHNLWHGAAERIARLDAVHSDAQNRFLDVWMRVGGAFRGFIEDDELFFAFLRRVLPSYGGKEMILYRGQIDGQPPGPSWSRSPHIALKFAQFGCDNVDPIKLAIRGVPKNKAALEGATVLKAPVPAAQIVSAPCLHGKAEGEYIIDPRRIEFTSEPAREAAIWIKHDLKSKLARHRA